MSSRPYRCPGCQKVLGTVYRKGPRGHETTRLVVAGRWVEVQLRWHGRYLVCSCRKRIRLANDVTIVSS